MPKEIVLAGGVRTAIGKFDGSLSKIPVADLGTAVIRESLKRAGILPSQVDEVFMGCILQAAQGQNVARQAAVNAEIPVEIPALTVNNLCGSGLKCINMAAAMITAGEADIIVAGGMENMSAAPYTLPGARFGYRMNDGKIIDTMVHDALTDAFNHYHMGITAENIAEKYAISREEQDEFAVKSQQKAEIAIKSGRFSDEIVPVPVKIKRDTILFSQDEYPRTGVTLESISSMKPAFKRDDGTVTAANSSGINDGAAAIVVMSAEKAQELGITPMARFVAGASAGVEPSMMGIGPVYSTKKVLAKAGMSLSDIDLIEANEAFAAQSIAVSKLLELNPDKVNVNGGAIALGHPVGASGARILITLLHEMQKQNSNYGLATLCVGGGMGVSAIVERI